MRSKVLSCERPFDYGSESWIFTRDRERAPIKIFERRMVPENISAIFSHRNQFKMTPEAETVKTWTPGLEAGIRKLGPGTFKPGFAVSLVSSSFRGGSSPTNLSLTRTRTRAHTADSRIHPNGRPAPDDFSPPCRARA